VLLNVNAVLVTGIGALSYPNKVVVEPPIKSEFIQCSVVDQHANDTVGYAVNPNATQAS